MRANPLIHTLFQVQSISSQIHFTLKSVPRLQSQRGFLGPYDSPAPNLSPLKGEKVPINPEGGNLERMEPFFVQGLLGGPYRCCMGRRIVMVAQKQTNNKRYPLVEHIDPLLVGKHL